MSKFHPLQRERDHAKLILELGVEGYHEWFNERRGTGRSTVRALQFITSALTHPGMKVLLCDHPHKMVEGRESRKQFAEDVHAMACARLGLRHLHIDPPRNPYESTAWTLTFEVRP